VQKAKKKEEATRKREVSDLFFSWIPASENLTIV
jgi:hypothetical protein